MMEDNILDIANYITCNMGLDYDTSQKLRNIILLKLDDYDISKKEKSIVEYTGGELEYFVKKFLVTKKVQGCTDRTLGYYGVEVRKILKKINKAIKEISSDDITIYIANRDIKDNVSKTTQDNELRCLRTFFAFLVEEEYILKNPCLKVRSIKRIKKKKQAFTQSEIEKMRSACKNLKETAMIETLLSTGCRAAELVQIKISDIKDDKITILGKGNKERVVYLNVKAQLSIARYLDERTDKNPYLFPRMVPLENRVGKTDYRNSECMTLDDHMSRETPNSIVKRIAKRVDVVAHTHKFRRTFATMALKRGMSLIQVSKLLGHESVETTQIYLDITEDELEQAHQKYVI